MRVEGKNTGDSDETTIRIVLVRHGETDFNLEKKVQGQSVGGDISLNENGLKQAKLLGLRLKEEKFDLVASSSLKRAIQTTKSVLSQFNNEERQKHRIHQYDGLREMNFGPQFEGKHFDKKMAKIPGNIHHLLSSIVRKWVVDGELDLCLPGGESPLQVENRARQAFFQIIHSLDQNNQPIPSASPSPKNILIVCHGRLLKILLCSLLDIGLENMEKFGQSNTAVNVLEFDRSSNSFSLSLLNCISHLDAPPNN
eukprot:TRINITY_DN2865_c0_g2_i2.p2 TRINITY_DN2865_c0_g2~~TRINITY_DN2865_c0_g2_i2.p2  ORF type:complete len:254 (-),score=91.24 TRINITY_DN2865_c0_g2_i2:230-991(-)